MNTPKNTKNIEEFSDEMGNTFIPISNIIDFINMQTNDILPKEKVLPAQKKPNITMTQNNILLKANTPTPAKWAQGEIEKKISDEEKIQKEQFLEKYFEMDVDATQNRPDIKNVNLDDENDIFRFSALQNLACAFSCCIETTSANRIEEIGKIFQGKNDGKFVHFVIYPSPKWGAIKLQNPKEALAYFEVYLKDEPQNDAEKADVMAQFRTLSHTVKNQNDHQ